ncbi:MAG: hypothetical protein U0X20_23560 [Caldilineaceae bacterium]
MTRVQTSHEDMAQQQQLLLAMRDKVSAVHEAIIRSRSVREQVESWKKRLTGNAPALQACDKLLGELAPIEDALYLPGDHKMTYGLIVRPRLNQVLASAIPVVASADAKPTASVQELAHYYFDQIDEQLGRLHQVLASDVEELNEAIAAARGASWLTIHLNHDSGVVHDYVRVTRTPRAGGCQAPRVRDNTGTWACPYPHEGVRATREVCTSAPESWFRQTIGALLRRGR